jgi:hypothetical protein
LTEAEQALKKSEDNRKRRAQVDKKLEDEVRAACRLLSATDCFPETRDDQPPPQEAGRPKQGRVKETGQRHWRHLDAPAAPSRGARRPAHHVPLRVEHQVRRVRHLVLDTHRPRGEAGARAGGLAVSWAPTATGDAQVGQAGGYGVIGVLTHGIPFSEPFQSSRSSFCIRQLAPHERPFAHQRAEWLERRLRAPARCCQT